MSESNSLTIEKNTQPLARKRIEWIDIVKGILIISVVLGHITGLFNIYIYSFHMGAFFILSGYTSGGKNKSLAKIVWSRVLAIILPLLVFILLGSILNQILYNNGVYEKVFSDLRLGVFETLATFLKTGDIYVQFLGASWFLITLVGISLLNKLILLVCKNKANYVYLLISFGLFLLEYYYMRIGFNTKFLIFNVGYVLIGQWFYSIGYFLREQKILKLYSKWWINLIIIGVTLCYMIIYPRFVPSTVNFPDFSFNNPFQDTLLPLVATILLANICFFFEKAPKFSWIWLSELGKKSLGIVLLHFLFNKIFMIICASGGFVEWSAITAVTPPAPIANQLWFPMLVFSLLLSYLTWWGLGKIPFVSILFGQDRKAIEKSYSFLSNFIVFKVIGKGLEFIRTKYFALLELVKNTFRKHPFESISLTIMGLAIVLPIVFTGIINPDELTIHLNASGNFKSGFDYAFASEVSKGRYLFAPFVSVISGIEFVFRYSWLIKVVDVAATISSVVMFSRLTYIVLKDKTFSIVLAALLGCLLPITFEFVAPNSNVLVYTVPFLLTLLSVEFYISYLKNNQLKDIVISSVLFLISCCFAEIFAVFAALFIAISMLMINGSFAQKIKKCIFPIGTFVLFLILYISINRQSGYSAFENYGFENFLKSFGLLILSSLPGYYLFKSPYSNHLGNLVYELTAIDIIRTIIIASVILVITIRIFKKKRGSNHGLKIALVIASVSFGMVLILSFPYALTPKYQGEISTGISSSSPASFISYFFAVLTISYLIWVTVKTTNMSSLKYVAIFAITGLTATTQLVNGIVAREQYQEYRQIEHFESLLRSTTFSNIKNITFYSEDVFFKTTRYEVPDNYWIDFNARLGSQTKIIRKEYVAKDNYIYNLSTDTYAFLIGDNILIMNKDWHEKVEVPINETDFVTLNISDSERDATGWYAAAFCPDNGAYIKTDIKYIGVGSDRYSVMVNYGYFPDDGWIENESEFYIRSKHEGKLGFGFYQKELRTENNNIRIYINNEQKYTFNFEDEYQYISFSCEPNSVLKVKIESDAVTIPSNPGDIRKLSVVLASVGGL